ncbi:MAG: HAD-IIIC family phosphatase [Patescibacteria group bacterium]
MINLIKKINEKNPQTLSDFFALSGEIKKELPGLEPNRRIKITFLSSFTTRGFEETLLVKCCKAGIVPEIYIADYNQYNQEILDDSSGLYEFNPDLVIVFIDVRTLLGELFFLPYTLTDEARRAWAEEQVRNLGFLIDKLKSKLNAKILFHNFETPGHSPLGILENKQEFGLVESIEWLNAELRNRYKKDSQVFIFDFNAFASDIGKRDLMDEKMYHLGDVKIAFDNIPILCESYLAYIKPIASKFKKCIVLDLDNTLWGGVIGEDGLSGIRIGPTPGGRPFMEFQKHLLALFQRGIILAINSKNNPDDVQEVFASHPDMILREEHFSAVRINWEDKASNIRAIAAELNIGVDSLVFFDDDKMNRELVRMELPEVMVVDLPEDPALYAKTLLGIHDFNILQLTEADKEKSKLYAEERRRKDFQVQATDMDDFLSGLAMEIEIEEMNDFNRPRLAQLTQKTNQFNLTTRRYTEEQLEDFRKKGDRIFSIRAKDKFGDSGIIAVVIIQKKIDDWLIDTFLMSCRVIGRKIENAILSHLIRLTREMGAQKLHGGYSPTEKNSQVQDFYKNNGFQAEEGSHFAQNWVYEVSNEYATPGFVKIIIKQ